MARSKGPNATPPRGKPSRTPEDGIKLLSEQISKARQLLDSPSIQRDDFRQWTNTTRNFVEMAFGENHPNISAFDSSGVFYISEVRPGWVSGGSNLVRRSSPLHYAEKLNGMIKALDGYIYQLKATSEIGKPSDPAALNVERKSSKKVFIVHGHDSTAREQLELIIHRLGLDPFVLQNTGGGGLTIIEALEREIGPDPGSTKFGIVLLTPDDVGYAKSEAGEKPQPRARQNVVLEMGMLIAALGRPNVAILKKGHIEVPSDAQGIIYIPFAEHVKETVPKLVDRLNDAGFRLNPSAITKASS
jgi:predicted nucleotide-binding protein